MCKTCSKLKLEIDNLKCELNTLLKSRDISCSDVLKASRRLDDLIIKYYRIGCVSHESECYDTYQKEAKPVPSVRGT